MLEWTAMTGEETVGIKNAIGPLCVSTVDPDVVEYVCHTNAKNYRLRMLPDAFRYVIKNKGITGSDGAYNREHRLMCQKPFMNAFSLEQFSVKVEERVAKLCDAWEKAGRRDGSLEVDVDDHSQRLTLDIVTSLAFNKDFKQVEGIDAQLNGGPKPDDTIISKVLDAYNDTSEIMGELFITPVPILRLQNFLGVGRVRSSSGGTPSWRTSASTTSSASAASSSRRTRGTGTTGTTASWIRCYARRTRRGTRCRRRTSGAT